MRSHPKRYELTIPQCAAVNFVEGTGETTSDCKNSTLTASFVPDSQLSALVGSDTSSGSGGNSSSTTAATTTGASATQTSASPTASTSDNAAVGKLASIGQSALASVLTVAAMGLLGVAYVL